MIDLQKNRNRFLLYIIGLALILRIVCIFIFGNTSNPEMWEFGLLARNLLAGHGYSYPYFGTNVISAYMPPALGYIYFIFFYLFGDNSISYILILLLNAVISAFNVLIIYKISEKIYDANIAVLSALYYCFSPIFLYSTITYNSIVIYHLLLGLLFLYFIKVYKSDNIKYSRDGIFMGIIFGISFYVRAEFLSLMFVICLLLFIKKQFKTSVLVLFVSLIILSPWTIRNYVTFAKIIPVTTSFGINFLNGHGATTLDTAWDEFSKATVKDSSYEVKVSEFAYKRTIYYITNFPMYEFKVAFYKIFKLWIVDNNRDKSSNVLYLITWLPTLLFFIIGYYRSLLLKVGKNKLIFMNIYLLFSTALVLIFFNVPRYQIQMSYLMIPTAMFGFYHVIYPLIKLSKNKTLNK